MILFRFGYHHLESQGRNRAILYKTFTEKLGGWGDYLLAMWPPGWLSILRARQSLPVVTSCSYQVPLPVFTSRSEPQRVNFWTMILRPMPTPSSLSMCCRAGPGHMFFRCSGKRVKFERLWIDSIRLKSMPINAERASKSRAVLGLLECDPTRPRSRRNTRGNLA